MQVSDVYVGICQYHVGMLLQQVFCCLLYVCLYRYLTVSVGICMYLHVYVSMLSVSACIACIGPLGHENHHSIPKTPFRGPALSRTHSGHPRACAQPLFNPIPTLPLDLIILFFLEVLCLDLSCHCHSIGQDAPDRPKLCPIALPSAQYWTRLCVLKSDIYLWLEGASKTPPLQQFCALDHLATVIDRPGSSRQAQTRVTRPPTRIVQDSPARAEIRRTFWVFWCSQVDPLDQFLLCRHIVANALHVPQTSTICRKQAVIQSVLWLWSNSSLVAEIWLFQVGGVGYVHVCACMCRYMHTCACIYRYVQVGMCRYVPGNMWNIFHHFLCLVSLAGSVVHSANCAPDYWCSSSRTVEAILL